jgi:hypothetical protein
LRWWTHSHQCFGHRDPSSPSRSSACWATYTVSRTVPGLAGPLRWYLIARLSVPVRATLIAAL